MRKLLAVLVAAAALVVPASASALTPRQIADQHAASHCSQLSCYEWHFVRSQPWMGGTQFFYNMHWVGYGVLNCTYATDPDVFVSSTMPTTEHNWGSGNTYCY